MGARGQMTRTGLNGSNWPNDVEERPISECPTIQTERTGRWPQSRWRVIRPLSWRSLNRMSQAAGGIIEDPSKHWRQGSRNAAKRASSRLGTLTGAQ